MEKKTLGSTNIQVTELCFGALSIGPLQANVSPKVGGKLIREALEKGVNFVDTAEMYETYEHIRFALDGFKEEAVIASKSTKCGYQEMQKAVQDALKKMNRDVIDIFHIHAAKGSPHVFKEREGAFNCLLDYKTKGYIRCVGVATHNVELASAAAEVNEVDILFPLINIKGMGIVNGTAEDMLKAIEKAYARGKGVYAMKALAGGNLIKEYQEAVDYVRSIPAVASVSIGMVKSEELDINLKVFNNEELPEHMIPKTAASKKPIILKNACTKCMTCVNFCPNQAIEFSEDLVWVNYNKCLLCGYCGPQCPTFAIRMI